MKRFLDRLLQHLPAKLFYGFTIASLLVFPGLVSGAPAQAPKTAYWIKLNYSSNKTICLGQQIEIWGEFGVNSGTLASVFGPDSIVTQAQLGTTSPQNIVPGTYSGPFAFYYTANHAGTDQIQAILKESGSKDVASNPISLKVTESCSYLFVLHGEVTGEFVGDEVDIALKITLDSRGVLKAPDANEPLQLESAGYIKMKEEVTKYQVPDCIDFSSEPGQGMGDLDGKAEPALDGYGVNVQLLRPNIEAYVDMKATCIIDGERKEITAYNAFTLTQTSNSGGAWIEQTFPADGGTFHINVDMLENMLKNIQSGGGSGSYTATLTLERIEK